jgi:hypothetical protein
MKRTKARRSAVLLTFLLASGTAFAQFDGFFTGYYAPSHWTTVLTNNAQFQHTANVQKQQNNLLISGAFDAHQKDPIAPQPPVSIIDLTIVLEGTGLQPVAFGYLFTGAADGYDKAQLICDSGSGFQVVADLSTSIGIQRLYSGQLQGGSTFGFRVHSNNDRNAVTLVLSPIPEPSALVLLALGAGAVLRHLRRRQS